VTLAELLPRLATARARGSLDAAVGGLALDSRRVKPGDLFFALPGVKADGARFAEAAVAAGAVAVVGAPGLDVRGATVIEVDEPRLALAQAAVAVHGDPSSGLRIIAVTGTNGKTTTTFMVEAIARAAGLRCGVIGTTGVRFDGASRPSAFTTPEAPQLQALLAEMLAAGLQVVAIEVSSHALVQRRAWGLGVDVAVFTNLTQDHLDYHGTMDAYLDAKLMLFDGRNGGGREHWLALVNGDDPASERVAALASRRHGRVHRFGTSEGCDPKVEVLDVGPQGLRLRLTGRHGRGAESAELSLPMFGRFNALNALAAFDAAVNGLVVEPALALRALESFGGVPGRLERVDAGQPYTVLVDYAHTPDALERALAACREHARGRVLCVFGCGGDRDRGKRPQMGAIAARRSDAAWVTNDNPRSEDPAAIAREIVAGAPGSELRIVLDRREAIAAALAAARTGDIVLVAGKGHETTQTIGDQVLPFDDRAVARELLGAAQ
jgi:UDP-N-acetylmuramoyl-L-alanyl-D-glutamate--2,6-diaminopimelate ligase